MKQRISFTRIGLGIALCGWAWQVACGAAAPPGAEPAPRPSKPNIVVILADDLGYGDVGFQGCKDIATPHLDALARTGTRFTSGYVTAPVCGPSRAALLTGQTSFDPQPLPARDPQYRPIGLDVRLQTMADYLGRAGYRCGALGKWHLGEERHFHPLSRGFHEFFGFLGGAHGYYEAEDPCWGPIRRDWDPIPKLGGYLTDVLGDEAVQFIGRNAQRPFFLYLAFNAVHAPFHPPPGVDPDATPSAGGTERPNRRGYGDMTASLDRAVGRVLDALDHHGLREKTLVFFLSDNGGPVKYGPGTIGASNTPLSGEKLEMREGGIRVPFVVSWPGVIPGATVDPRPVIQLDILPTALAAAGVPVDPAWKLEGVDLLPFLTRRHDAAPHQALYWRVLPQMAIRKGPWKLVRWHTPGRKTKLTDWQLYNLDEDIAEQKDLAAVRPELVNDLRQEWETWSKAMPTKSGRAASRGPASPARHFAYADGVLKVEAERSWNRDALRGEGARVFSFRIVDLHEGLVRAGFTLAGQPAQEISLLLHDAGNRSWGVLTGSFRCPGAKPFTVTPAQRRKAANPATAEPPLPVGSEFLGVVGPGWIRDREISLYLTCGGDGWVLRVGDEVGGETSLKIPFTLLPADSSLKPFVSLPAGLAAKNPKTLGIVLPDRPADVVRPELGRFGSVQYRFYRPRVEPQRLYPLVVCIHGAGGVGDDNRGRGIQALGELLQAGVQAQHPCFLLAPQKPAPLPMWADWPFKNGSYDLDQVKETVHIRSVHDLIVKVMKEQPIDPKRVYVTGQSMGGFGAWDMALRYPDLFAAVVPLCGGGSPKHAAKLKDMAVWAFHGDQDPTVPVSGSREMAAALQAAGSRKARYTEYPGAGHVIMEKVWSTDGIMDWLFAQHR